MHVSKKLDAMIAAHGGVVEIKDARAIGFKGCYYDGCCHIIKLTNGAEVCGNDPAKLQRLAERVVDGKFELLPGESISAPRVVERLQ